MITATVRRALDMQKDDFAVGLADSDRKWGSGRACNIDHGERNHPGKECCVSGCRSKTGHRERKDGGDNGYGFVHRYCFFDSYSRDAFKDA